MPRIRCTCHFGSLNPSCRVDHELENERIGATRDGLLADLEWVARTLAECPLLSYVRSWKRTRDDGTVYVYPADVRGTATLTAILSGSDEELLAAAKALRAHLVSEAQSEAEQAEQDRLDELDDAA